MYNFEKNYQEINFSENQIEIGEYESCQFLNCSFNLTDLSDFIFDNCTFKNCDFSRAQINNTAFRACIFKSSKLTGLTFIDCNQFGFSIEFENCLLNFSSFFRMILTSTKFKDCSLKDVDFSETDLMGINFENCNLLGANFDKTNLIKSDFRTAINYDIDLDKNQIKKAKFSQSGIFGLLSKYDIEIS